MNRYFRHGAALATLFFFAAAAHAQDLDLATNADPILHGVGTGGRAGQWLDQGPLSQDRNRRDLIIGSPGGPGVVGRVYVMFGGPIPSGDVSLSTAAHVQIDGATAGDRFGQATAAGNVVSLETSASRDLVIGAPASLNNRGIVYVFRGNLTAGSHLTTASAVVRIIGDFGDELGASLATGDLNNDGVREIIIGAPGTSRIYVINGSTALSGTIDLSNQAASFALSGVGLGAVLTAGDVTGDGIYDLIIGAPAANAAYMVRGRTGAFPSVMLLPSAADAVFSGVESGDRAGAAVRILDLDDDGRKDLAIGAPGADGPNNSRAEAGEVYVLWGSATLSSRSLANADVTFYGISPFLRSGGLITAGDINRDTPDDLVLLAAGGANDAGELHIYYGRERSLIGTLQPNGHRIVDLAASGQISRRIFGDGSKGPISSALVYELTGEGARDVVVGIASGDSDTGAAYFAVSPRMLLSAASITNTLPEGGSAPASLTLTNPSPIAITWTATSTQPWLTVATASGSAKLNSPSTISARISAETLAAGTYSATLNVRSTSVDLDMVLPVAVSITVTENRHMAFIAPAPAPNQEQPFLVRGWAIDTGVSTGTGVDAVDIYGGPNTSSLVLLGHATYGIARADVGTTYGSRFTNSGFELSVQGLGGGANVIVAKARTTGQTGFWTKTGGSLNITTAAVPSNDDFTGDRRMDLLWQHTDGTLALWQMDGTVMVNSMLLNPARAGDNNWKIVATGDMNGDGKSDILWQYTDGSLAVWLMNGTTLIDGAIVNPSKPDRPGWRVAGSADVNGDHKDDIIWQHETEGWLAVWLMNGINIIDGQMLVPNQLSDPARKIIGTGDVNRDGKADILFRHAQTGGLAVWYMNGPNLVDGSVLAATEPDRAWQVASIGDIDGDSKIDLVWQNVNTGALRVWLMNGPDLIRSVVLTPGSVSPAWKLVGPK
jgi:hypothetical protein